MLSYKKDNISYIFHKLISITLLMLYPLFLSGCSGALQSFGIIPGYAVVEKISTADQVYGFRKIPINLETISFKADKDANQNSATIVDLLVIYDGGPLKEALTMDAQTYFGTKEEFIRNNSGLVQALSWEIVPGQSLNMQPVKMDAKAPLAVILFASYWSRGKHSFRIGNGKHYLVILEKYKFHVGVKNVEKK